VPWPLSQRDLVVYGGTPEVYLTLEDAGIDVEMSSQRLWIRTVIRTTHVS